MASLIIGFVILIPCLGLAATGGETGIRARTRVALFLAGVLIGFPLVVHGNHQVTGKSDRDDLRRTDKRVAELERRGCPRLAADYRAHPGAVDDNWPRYRLACLGAQDARDPQPAPAPQGNREF